MLFAIVTVKKKVNGYNNDKYVGIYNVQHYRCIQRYAVYM